MDAIAERLAPRGAAGPTPSELFPLRVRALRAARRKAFLMPAVLAVLIAVALAVTAGSESMYWLPVGAGDAYPVPIFNLILGPAIAAASVYAIYRLAGKPVSGWLLLLPAAAEVVLLEPHVFALLRLPFSAIATGTGDPRIDDFQTWSAHVLIAVAPLEELVKALPILAAWWIGCHTRGWLGRHIAVREPLDGILLGCASGAAFACYETLVLYIGGLTTMHVPLTRGLYDAMQTVAAQHLATAGGNPQALLAQLTLALHGQAEILVARLVNQLAGHVAWTGLAGYYIGLAALRPWGRARSLATGFAIAIGLHWMWDSAFHRDVDRTVTIVIAGIGAVVSYAALVTATLKARQISPTRATNFATTGRSLVSAAAGTEGGGAPLRLALAALDVSLAAGTRLTEGDIVGLISAQIDGTIARVEPHPDDPAALGLHNLSTSAWSARYADGAACVVGPGTCVRLDPGLAIDFGQGGGWVERRGAARVWSAESSA